jgi:hypothetical protein
MTLSYARTRCDCHPETCCCPDYTVFCDGVVLAKVNDEKMAQKLCEFVLPVKEADHGKR